ncbi:MAG: dihydrolipoyl dehydrogenase [Anaerolineae bacterium]|nr:dihydrolipoyl dehydrogenase [Anaerolineae bacterium]
MPGDTLYDLVVLGGGPGGYSCALRAAQRGLRVALVEKDRIGGVCLNRGCIPTKVALQAAAFMRGPAAAAPFGVSLGPAKLNLPALRQHQAKVVRWLTSGVEALLYQRGVEVFPGDARLAPDGVVGIRGQEGHRTVRGSIRVIATGSRERQLPQLPIDGARVLGSTEALALEELPGAIAVVGAGAVGTEFASMFADFGSEVTLIEALPHILPLEDRECAEVVAQSLASRGVRILTDAPVRAVGQSGGRVLLECQAQGQAVRVTADKVLVAVGRVPNTDDIGLEELGVRRVRGFIEVDADLRTSVPDLYAIGDCVPTLALAHVAAAEGKHVADLIAGGRPRRLDQETMPRATYAHPEIASVGLTQEQAESQGLDVAVTRYPLRANGKAAIYGEIEGMVKIVAEEDTHVVRGVHIVGPSASELIAEAALAMRLEATAAEIAATVHAHPTVSEAVLEGAESLLGVATHAG